MHDRLQLMTSVMKEQLISIDPQNLVLSPSQSRDSGQNHMIKPHFRKICSNEKNAGRGMAV